MDKTTEFTFGCPHCGQHLAAEPDMVGMELECPVCGKTLQIPSQSPSPLIKPQELRVVPSSPYKFIAKRCLLSLKSRKCVFIVALLILALMAVSALFRKEIPLPMDNFEIDSCKSPGCDVVLNPHDITVKCDTSKGVYMGEVAEYQIPLEMQSGRVTVEIILDKKGKYRDGVLVSILSGGGKCPSYIDIRESDLELGKCVLCEIEIKDDSIFVRKGKHKVKIDKVGWFRLAKIKLHEGDYTLRNIRTFPSNKHREAVKVFNRALNLSGEKRTATMQKAANLGLAEAQQYLWMLNSYDIYLGNSSASQLSESDRRKLNEAHKWLLKAANQGDISANMIIGKMMFLGEWGVEKNHAKALKHLQWAAKGGSVKGLFYFGSLLLRGDGVPHDMKTAQTTLSRCIQEIMFPSQESKENDLDNFEKGWAYYLCAETYLLAKDGAKEDRELGIAYLKTACMFYGNESAKELLEHLDE